MKKIGSGFHDGPPSVTRSRWAISRPHRIHAHGSYVGVDGNSSVSADTARQPTMIKTIWVPWRSSASEDGFTRSTLRAGWRTVAVTSLRSE